MIVSRKKNYQVNHIRLKNNPVKAKKDCVWKTTSFKNIQKVSLKTQNLISN